MTVMVEKLTEYIDSIYRIYISPIPDKLKKLGI